MLTVRVHHNLFGRGDEQDTNPATPAGRITRLAVFRLAPPQDTLALDEHSTSGQHSGRDRVHDARLDELDVESVLAFAEYVLSNPGRLWGEASLEQKQRLQKVWFPRGVTYSQDGRFGTAETSVIFRLLQALPTEKSSEASPTGFEPVLPT